MKDLLHDKKRSSKTSKATLSKECSHSKALEQELKDSKRSHTTLSPTTLVTEKPSTPPAKAAKPMQPPPQPEAGPSRLPPPQPEAGPSTQPATSNLTDHLDMEVDDETPDWLTEEQGYRLSTGPAPISKRWQCRGLGPPVSIRTFNNIKGLEKDYLAHAPGNALTDPTFFQKREGVVNRIVAKWAVIKNRLSGPVPSIMLPSPRGSHPILMEASARAPGKSPGDRRTTTSRRPTMDTHSKR